MLVDTNIIIDHLRGEEKATLLLSQIESRSIKAYISTLTEAEVLSWSKLSQKQISEIAALLNIFNRIEINSEIAQKGAEFRRKYGSGLVDALIAASASIYNIKLATRNIRHFAKIKEVEIYNIDRSSTS